MPDSEWRRIAKLLSPKSKTHETRTCHLCHTPHNVESDEITVMMEGNKAVWVCRSCWKNVK